MTRTRKTMKAPVKGAARHYVLVPAEVEDAFAFAKATQERKGYTVVDTGYRIGERHGAWLMVELWAVPPQRQGEGE
jgi:hypothetical protein